jgi:hypothetical protein
MINAQTKTADMILIANDFSPYPAGRYRKDGPYSGEAFREDALLPKLNKYGHAIVNIDGVAGLPSSFWEEVFGGLVRRHNMTPEYVKEHVKVSTSDTSLEPFTRLAFKFAEEAARK